MPLLIVPRLPAEPLPDWAVPWFAAGIIVFSGLVVAFAWRDRRR